MPSAASAPAKTKTGARVSSGSPQVVATWIKGRDGKWLEPGEVDETTMILVWTGAQYELRLRGPGELYLPVYPDSGSALPSEKVMPELIELIRRLSLQGWISEEEVELKFRWRGGGGEALESHAGSGGREQDDTTD